MSLANRVMALLLGGCFFAQSAVAIDFKQKAQLPSQTPQRNIQIKKPELMFRETPPLIKVNLCEDSDKGEIFEVAGIARHIGTPPTMAFDHCSDRETQSGDIHSSLAASQLENQTWLQKIKNLISSLYVRPDERAAGGTDAVSIGTHNGSYKAFLQEAVCKNGAISSVQHHCVDDHKSCVEGRCQNASCSMDKGHNVLHYSGFAVAANGSLRNAPNEVSQTADSCKNRETLLRNRCATVPENRYVVMGFDNQKYVANTGDPYIQQTEQICHGEYHFGPVTLTGCIDKQTLLASLREHHSESGVDDLVRRVERGPDFATCGENPRSDCATSPDPASCLGEDHAGGTPVTTQCLPLDGTEANNPCGPSTNGIKTVLPDGTLVEFFCNRCSQDLREMMQWRCLNGYPAHQSILCPTKCTAGINRCDDCANTAQDWCPGEMQ